MLCPTESEYVTLASAHRYERTGREVLDSRQRLGNGEKHYKY